MVFQTVCRYHGGASKNAKHAAQRRLGEALDIMAKGLLTIAQSAESESVRLAAIKEVLNLGGITAKTSVEVDASVSLKPFQEILAGIAPVTREESRAARGVPGSPADRHALAELDAMRHRDIIDAEVVSESPARPATTDADERKARRGGSGRPKHAERRTEPVSKRRNVSADPLAGLDPDDALAKANTMAGHARPKRRDRGRR
ncbi:hypothetical protein [Mycolicibacterium murale]|uniref:hypothetical protein n=1 Tax=Mycolicibacterium murale TaxID=182220 RepID=UPI00187572B4|nr:hypothetical protein [Mycolicibacterium murale]MCV7185428.1 hypothetical protein [Mycolicibacterium murale]